MLMSVLMMIYLRQSYALIDEPAEEKSSKAKDTSRDKVRWSLMALSCLHCAYRHQSRTPRLRTSESEGLVDVDMWMEEWMEGWKEGRNVG
jgi:hypothetical protein